MRTIGFLILELAVIVDFKAVFVAAATDNSLIPVFLVIITKFPEEEDII